MPLQRNVVVISPHRLFVADLTWTRFLLVLLATPRGLDAPITRHRAENLFGFACG